MLSAKDALRQTLKGDPDRMVLIAEASIKEAIKNHNTRCLIKFSKHLYGDADIRVLIEKLKSEGYFCLPLIFNEGNSHELEVRW